MVLQVGTSQSLKRRGLLRRDLLDGETTPYDGLDREVLLDEPHNIFLPSVTCGDAGVYLCNLAAPVGEQNRDGRILLTLTGKSLAQQVLSPQIYSETVSVSPSLSS